MLIANVVGISMRQRLLQQKRTILEDVPVENAVVIKSEQITRGIDIFSSGKVRSRFVVFG